MNISNRVINLAKERALFGFRVTVQHMLRDAGDDVLRLMKEASTADEDHALKGARQFIDYSGKQFQRELEAAYRTLLDRAMETMYADWRRPLGEFTADDLSLIDDDTMNRQIKLDHAVKRLRDADDEHLQRVNLIIGRMHGKEEARERENPFRPYLMARALHQVVSTMVGDNRVNQRLFDILADALAGRLPEFYRAIREVFESNGIHAQLVAKKSPYFGGPHAAGRDTGLSEQVARDLNTRVIPGLKQALDLMNAAAPTAPGPVADAAPGAPAKPLEIASFVDGIFHAAPEPGVAAGAASQPASGAVRQSPASPLQAGSRALVNRLDQFQQQAARSEPADATGAPQQSQLFALSEQIGPDEATRLERVAIDVVAVLFEMILADRQISEGVRTQIGRLQIPFLKAAMLRPEILQQAGHPARQLVNRMGSAAVGLDADSAAGAKVEREIARIVARILGEFKDDVGIFAECLAEFDRFLADQLYRADPDAERSVGALEAVEGAEASRQRELPKWLRAIDLDPRVADFIGHTWTRVLARERELRPGIAANPSAPGFFDVLPDLVWSVQDKQSADERAMLVRGLSGLVKRLEAGLSLLGMSQEDMRTQLDRLVAVHAQVLRGNTDAREQQLPTLREWRVRFARLRDEIVNAGAAPIEAGHLQTELAKHGVAVDLDLDTGVDRDAERNDAPSQDNEDGWLEGIQLGTSVERWSDEGYKTGQLVWIGRGKSLYLFKVHKQAMPVVYSKTSLIKALREGSLRLLEHAPVFERAVESLLISVRSVDGGV